MLTPEQLSLWREESKKDTITMTGKLLSTLLDEVERMRTREAELQADADMLKQIREMGHDGFAQFYEGKWYWYSYDTICEMVQMGIRKHFGQREVRVDVIDALRGKEENGE